MKILLNNKGLTLLEAIFAIAIIMVGLFSAMGLVISNISASTIATGKVISAGLAWEGLEVVRNIRDSNWLDDSKLWNSGILGSDTTAIPVFNKQTGEWYLDFTPDVIVGDDGTRLYKDGALYVQSTTPPSSIETQFYRMITIEPDIADPLNKFLIKSRVIWKNRGVEREVLAEEIMSNWK